MKKILLILIVSMSLISCGEPEQSINREQLQERNEVKYEVNQETPYTGKVIDYYENGQIQSKENYKDGKLNGERITYYENGQIEYKENYKGGEYEGESFSYYKNGQVSYKRLYKNGEREGIQTYYHYNGQIESKVNIKNGELIGEYIKYYENGQIKEKGSFINGTAGGEWIYYYQNGQVHSKGFYKSSGAPIGNWIYYYEDGSVKSKLNFNGKYGSMLEGKQIYFYRNGKRKSEVNYAKRDGGPIKTIGISIEYDKNGNKIFETEFKNGHAIKWTQFNIFKHTKDGDITTTTYLALENEMQWIPFSITSLTKVNKIINGFWRKYKGAFEITTGYVRNGKKEGEWMVYDRIGNLYEKEYYENGQLKRGKIYYENGIIQRVGNYKKWKQEGEWTYYSETGEIKFKENYKDGIRIK